MTRLLWVIVSALVLSVQVGAGFNTQSGFQNRVNAHLGSGPKSTFRAPSADNAVAGKVLAVSLGEIIQGQAASFGVWKVYLGVDELVFMGSGSDPVISLKSTSNGWINTIFDEEEITLWSIGSKSAWDYYGDLSAPYHAPVMGDLAIGVYPVWNWSLRVEADRVEITHSEGSAVTIVFRDQYRVVHTGSSTSSNLQSEGGVEPVDVSLEVEPNNLPLQATEISLGDVVQGSLMDAQDSDYYAVSVSAPTSLSVGITTTPRKQYGEMDLHISIYDESFTKLGGYVSDRSEFSGVRVEVESGTILIAVTGPSSTWADFEGNLSYFLMAFVGTEVSRMEREPNDTSVNATYIADGELYEGHLHGFGDIDYFAIDLPSSQEIGVALSTTVREQYGEMDLTLSVLNRQQVKIGGFTTQETLGSTRLMAGPGRVYVSIAGPTTTWANFENNLLYGLRVDADAVAPDPQPDMVAVTAFLREGGDGVGSQVTGPAAGDQVSLCLRYRNDSAISASGWGVEGVLDGVVISRGGEFAAPAGEEGEIFFPWTAIAGVHTFEWRIDPDGMIEEASETNNNASLTFTVTVPFQESGTNAGFTATVIGPTAVNAGRGQSVGITLEAQNVTQAKAAIIRVNYDPTYFAYDGFVGGPLIPGIINLTGTPIDEEDGSRSVQGAGTQISGTPGQGGGIIGTMNFIVLADIPPEGSFISVTEVQIQASSTDKNKLLFATGIMGLLVTGMGTGTGTNAGFTTTLVGPTTVTAEKGQTVSITVEVHDAIKAKGAHVVFNYDPAYFAFDGFNAGTLSPGMLVLPGTPIDEEDGSRTVKGGGLQLFGTPGQGSGIIGTMNFTVLADIPPEGTFISVTEVGITASSTDKDVLSFATGTMGVLVMGTRTGATNQPPVLAVIWARTIEERQVLSFALSATDPDGDVLTYSVTNNPAGSSLMGNTFTWTPTSGQAGSYTLTFTVSDGRGGTDTESVIIDVTTSAQVNQSPVLAAIGGKAVEEGQSLSFTLSATDADSDPLTYSVTGNPIGSTLESRSFSWMPTAGQVGSYTTTFTVSDGNGGTDSESVTIAVTAPVPVNRAPVLADVPYQEVQAGEEVRFTLSATDADGDALTYSVAGNLSGSSLSGATFAWTPTSGQAGSYTPNFIVSDGRGGSDTQAVEIVVLAKGVPAISVLPTALNFGAVIIGESKALNLVVFNEGTGPLRALNIVSSNPSIRVSETGLTLDPGASKTLLVTLDPSVVGTLRGTLDIPSNDPEMPLLQVSLSGTVERTPNQPSLVLDVGLVEFGQVAVGETASFVAPIRNEGSATLDISNVVSDDRQVVGSPSSLKIPPQESSDLTLLFRPLPEEAREGKVTLFTNEPEQSRIEIAWSAFDVATPFLSVTSVKPAAVASGVASDTQIEVTFSAPLFERRGFIGIDAQLLPEPLSGPLSGAVELRGNGRIAVFPVELASDQVYRLVIFGATGRDGLQLFEAFETTFSTGAGEPVLASVSGSVVVAEGAHPTGSVFLFDSSSNRLVAQTAISLDGTFSLNGVPTGSYTVFADGTLDGDAVGGSYDVDGDGEPDRLIINDSGDVDGLDIMLVVREKGSVGSEAAITLDLDARVGDQGVTHLRGVGSDEEIVVEIYSAAVEDLTGFAVSVSVDTSQVFFQSAEAGANLLDESDGTVLYLSHFAPQRSVIEFGGSVMGPTSETAVSGAGLLGRWHFRTAPDFGGEVSIQIEDVTFRTLESRTDWAPDISGVVSAASESEKPVGPISIDFSPSPGDQKQVVAGSAVPGSRYALQLHVTDAPEIKGWSATLVYDPIQLAYETGSFEVGDFIPGLFGLANEKEGRVEVGGAVLGAEATSSGDGFLGTLAFEVADGFSGDTEIVVTSVSLNTVEAGEEILSVRFVARITSEAVQASVVGDFSGDGIVNFSDFFLFADAFGGSDPLYDLTGDGAVNFSDFFVFADQFGAEARAKLLVLAQEHLGLPPATTLGANYPNPFNAETTIPFQLGEAAEVELALYNLAGQQVATLADDTRAAGSYTIRWDGRDDAGQALASGVYLYRLRVGQQQVEMRKSLLLR
jgi:hypothetical protein